MPLQLEQKPGVWTNSNWAAGTAGTFAVIIGVSRYRYLRDGEGDDGHGLNLAPDNYDLGQLTVSALTATRFFEWLRDRYRMTGAPMAKCWLLLAATDDEEKVYGKAFPHSAEPTLAACQQAIGEWYAAARDLPAAAAEASRMLFFFSGHGVQLFRDRQLLLPCDYLRPPLQAANQAISTSNLSIGLESLAPKHQFFFIDACRTDHERLLDIPGLEGLKILDGGWHGCPVPRWSDRSSTPQGQGPWPCRQPRPGTGSPISARRFSKRSRPRASFDRTVIGNSVASWFTSWDPSSRTEYPRSSRLAGPRHPW